MISQAELHTPPEQLATKKVIAERVENLEKRYHNIYLECVHIIKKADADVNDVIGRRIILCQIAAYCTCDVGFVPRAIVGKERTMKVSTRNKENDIFLHGKKIVTAKLSLTESNELCIYGTSTDHGDGTFSVSFTAQSIGVHNLEVEIGGQPIKGSPFSLTIRPPRTTSYNDLSFQKSITTNNRPYDIAFTEDGTLAVAEYGYHTVSLYSTINEEKLHTFGTNGSSGGGENKFNGPSGIAINGDEMYVTDFGNHRVKKIRLSDRSTIGTYGSKGKYHSQFSNPCGICIDPEGKLFIADSGNNRIQVHQSDGTFSYTIIGDPQKEESVFKYPWGVAFDPQGRLHIAACGSNCIKVFTPEGTYVKSYGGNTTKNPAGIAIDEEGYIAISEHGNNNSVWIYNSNHTEPPVKTIRNFSYPAGIACDAEGTFWITDSCNNRVLQY